MCVCAWVHVCKNGHLRVTLAVFLAMAAVSALDGKAGGGGAGNATSERHHVCVRTLHVCNVCVRVS